MSVCLASMLIGWLIVMATWKFHSIIFCPSANRDDSRFRAKKNLRAPCEYLFFPFSFVSACYFEFFWSYLRFSGWVFAKEEKRWSKRVVRGKWSFGSPPRHEYFHRFYISQFRFVFPKFRKIFTPWEIFKREIRHMHTHTHTHIYTPVNTFASLYRISKFRQIQSS